MPRGHYTFCERPSVLTLFLPHLSLVLKVGLPGAWKKPGWGQERAGQGLSTRGSQVKTAGCTPSAPSECPRKGNFFFLKAETGEEAVAPGDLEVGE